MKHKSGLAMIFGELEAMSRVEQHPFIVSLHLAYHDRYGGEPDIVTISRTEHILAAI